MSEQNERPTAAAEIAKTVLQPVNTPTKRIGFVVMCIGAAILALGWNDVWHRTCCGDSLLETYFSAFDNDSYDYEVLWMARWGTLLASAGLLASYLYDASLGRLLTWIKTGS